VEIAAASPASTSAAQREMPDFPNWFAGAATLAALVGLGIFVYPWLLGRKSGAVAVGASTLLLAVLYLAFDRRSGAGLLLSTSLALLWALAPVAVGVIVHRLQNRSTR
jgi:hypothetical protein